MDEASPARPYHHGNLRSALVEAGYALAVDEGPQALTLRGATRRAGVSPTAAYRHFADLDELRTAVGFRALQAMAGAIEQHQQAVVALAGAWWFIGVGIASVLAAWFYTGGSRPYGYLGLGEVMVFVFFDFVNPANVVLCFFIIKVMCV